MSVSVTLRRIPARMILVALPTWLTSTGPSSIATSLRRNAQQTYFAYQSTGRGLEKPTMHGVLLALEVSNKTGFLPCTDLTGPESSFYRERADNEPCWQPMRVWRNVTHCSWRTTLPTLR